jgi:hypothetical protein
MAGTDHNHIELLGKLHGKNQASPAALRDEPHYLTCILATTPE